jgi:hypothetical protein
MKNTKFVEKNIEVFPKMTYFTQITKKVQLINLVVRSLLSTLNYGYTFTIYINDSYSKFV